MDRMTAAQMRDLPDEELRERRARLGERACEMMSRLWLLEDEIRRREREREIQMLIGGSIVVEAVVAPATPALR